MKSVCSVSGGKSSAYLAANFPADINVFSLVRIEDYKCKFKDELYRQKVEDRLQLPFVGTAEYDEIIYTIFDLEQFLGKKIDWVSGLTFEQVLKQKGGWLPNKLHRYCTYDLKIIPVFDFVRSAICEPVTMSFGFRANELRRVNDMRNRCNDKGVLQIKAVTGKHKSGRNKWGLVDYCMPVFPLYDNQVFKDTIVNYWQDKAVRFAPYNNCVGCFHRNELFLRYMYQEQPDKMQWFEDQENGPRRGTWRAHVRYEKIKKMLPQLTLFPNDFSGCDSGFCGL